MVVAVSLNEAPLLGDDNGRAGVLAHGQDAARRDIRVLQQIEGDELFVRRHLRIIKDAAELREMTRAKQMVDVDERLLAEKTDRLAIDDQNIGDECMLDANTIRAHLFVGRRIGPEREEGVIGMTH